MTRLSEKLRHRRDEARRLDSVRATCDAALAALGATRHDDLDTFRGRVEARQQREIRLVPFPLKSDSIHGLLVSTDEVDFVVFEQDTLAFHQVHIVLHELSHIVLSHHTSLAADSIPAIVKSIRAPTSAPVRVLGRHTYEDTQELEAEMMASMLGMTLNHRAAQASTCAAARPDERIARILQTFSGRRRA